MTEDELLKRLDRTLERNSEMLALAARGFEQFVSSNTRLERTVVRLDRSVDRLERTVDDLRDQVRANTEALLRLIDRLGPTPGTTG